MQYGLSPPPNLRIDTAPPNSGQRTTQYRRTGLPMVVLICKDLTFCQFFFSRETRKLIPEQRVAIRQQSQNKLTIQERTHHDVCEHLVIRHLYVAHSDPQAKDFFELEFDSGTHFSKLVAQIFRVRNWSRKLPG